MPPSIVASSVSSKSKDRIVRTGRGGLANIKPVSAFQPDSLPPNRDVVRFPAGREIEPRHTNSLCDLQAAYSGRGGIGNIYGHFLEPGVFARVILYEQGVIQAYKDTLNEEVKTKTGRGGTGNIRRARSKGKGLYSPRPRSTSDPAPSRRSVSSGTSGWGSRSSVDITSLTRRRVWSYTNPLSRSTPNLALRKGDHTRGVDNGNFLHDPTSGSSVDITLAPRQRASSMSSFPPPFLRSISPGQSSDGSKKSFFKRLRTRSLFTRKGSRSDIELGTLAPRNSLSNTPSPRSSHEAHSPSSSVPVPFPSPRRHSTPSSPSHHHSTVPHHDPFGIRSSAASTQLTLHSFHLASNASQSSLPTSIPSASFDEEDWLESTFNAEDIAMMPGCPETLLERHSLSPINESPEGTPARGTSMENILDDNRSTNQMARLHLDLFYASTSTFRGLSHTRASSDNSISDTTSIALSIRDDQSFNSLFWTPHT